MGVEFNHRVWEGPKPGCTCETCLAWLGARPGRPSEPSQPIDGLMESETAQLGPITFNWNRLGEPRRGPSGMTYYPLEVWLTEKVQIGSDPVAKTEQVLIARFYCGEPFVLPPPVQAYIWCKLEYPDRKIFAAGGMFGDPGGNAREVTHDLTWAQIDEWKQSGYNPGGEDKFRGF